MKDDAAPSLKILVVDDEPDIVEEIVELLEDEGYACEGVSDPKLAISMVEQDLDVGILISDIRMPALSGLELSRQLLQDRDDERDLHIILVTGHAGMAEAIEALKLGADDFLTKPLNAEQLLHSVKRSHESAILRDKDRELKLRLAAEAQTSADEASKLSAELARRNTELTRINLELIDVSKLKDEFLGMISHELNTPLNSIIGFSQLLQEMFVQDGDEQKRELSDYIITSANRLNHHINSILNIAKAQSGDLKLEKQEFLIADLFQNSVTKYQDLVADRKGEIKTDISVEGLSYTADYGLLGEALGCLIENSTKFSNEGVEVVLRAEKTDLGIRMIVTDNGLGMDDQTIHASIDPLRQGDGKLSRRFQGMGLGLPLARQYVRLHGGSMDIESTLGEGTSVIVELPDQDGL